MIQVKDYSKQPMKKNRENTNRPVHIKPLYDKSDIAEQ